MPARARRRRRARARRAGRRRGPRGGVGAELVGRADHDARSREPEDVGPPKVFSTGRAPAPRAHRRGARSDRDPAITVRRTPSGSRTAGVHTPAATTTVPADSTSPPTSHPHVRPAPAVPAPGTRTAPPASARSRRSLGERVPVHAGRGGDEQPVQVLPDRRPLRPQVPPVTRCTSGRSGPSGSASRSRWKRSELAPLVGRRGQDDLAHDPVAGPAIRAGAEPIHQPGVLRRARPDEVEPGGAELLVVEPVVRDDPGTGRGRAARLARLDDGRARARARPHAAPPPRRRSRHRRRRGRTSARSSTLPVTDPSSRPAHRAR